MVVDFSGWLSSGEAARRIGVTYNWVTRLREQGHVETIWTPAGYLYKETDVDRLALARWERLEAGLVHGRASKGNRPMLEATI